MQLARARLDGLPTTALPGGLHLARADTFRSRLLGLAGLDSIPPGLGLLLPRCRSIHTFGMRFALDLIWLDGDGELVAVVPAVQPWRVETCGHAASVVETRAGQAARFLAAGLGRGPGPMGRTPGGSIGPL
jgi:uncharacterized protein